jgi:hypothetical protein
LGRTVLRILRWAAIGLGTLTAVLVVVALIENNDSGTTKPANATSATATTTRKLTAHEQTVIRQRKEKAARHARYLREKAAAAAKREAKQQAARQAAEEKAANAWHQGYVMLDDTTGIKRAGGSCADFAQNGCWRFAVITEYGCVNYIGLQANEYSGGAIVAPLLDNSVNGLPAKTPIILELDAQSSGDTIKDIQVQCT